ncbi:MAG: hypothetical protein ABJA90_10635 [Ginsengibacter sp.]
MNTKIKTLYTIYGIVKNNPHPTNYILTSRELILKQKGPWDEVVKDLSALEDDGFVTMVESSTVSITEKGFSYAQKTYPLLML